MTTPIAGLEEIASSQANKYLTHNTALRMLEGLLFRALSATTAAQPSSPAPANGDVYIIPSGATGADWGGYSAGDVAIYNSGWSAFSPWAGLRLWVVNLHTYLIYNGTSWVPVSVAGLRVEDRDLSILPTSPVPASGAVYIVAAGSPQSFATGTLAIADGAGGWFAVTPTDGDFAYIKDEKKLSAFSTGSPYGWSAGISLS